LIKDELGKNPSYQNDSKSSNGCPKCSLSPARGFPLFYGYWRNADESCPVFAFIRFNYFITYIDNLIVFVKLRIILLFHMADDTFVVNMTSVPFCIIKSLFSIVTRNNSCSRLAKESTTNTSMFR